MTAGSIAVAFDRAALVRIADGLAVATAVALPWSTTLTGILIGLWLLAFFPTVDRDELHKILATPAGGLPVLLWALGVLGMLWSSDVPFAEKIDGLGPFHKLLVIPLLMTHFRQSERGHLVMIGFIASCTVILVESWFLFLKPDLIWRGPGTLGVPVKDYIAQGAEFTVCVFLLGGLAMHVWQGRRRRLAVEFALLALAFLANVIFVTGSRTPLVVIPLLLILIMLAQSVWKGLIGALLAVIVAAAALSLAPVARTNIMQIVDEVREFRPEGASTRAGERLEYWRKSIGFVIDAPLIGHGTGSIRDQYRRSVVGKTGMAALASANPHNQTLAVGVQLGLLGAAVLMAMWISHLLLFRASSLVAWIGLTLVWQNIIGSLFNSHLFDFTHGWGYVIGVGVAGGTMLKHRWTVEGAGAGRRQSRQ